MENAPAQNALSARAQLEQLVTLVSSEAATKGWPSVTYQAAFVTVVRASAGERWLEGKSCYWESQWSTDPDRTDHPVSVAGGADAWRTFLGGALYYDLLRAQAQLRRF
jgi:hypothetical protein